MFKFKIQTLAVCVVFASSFLPMTVSVQAAELKIFVPNNLKGALSLVAPAFEKSSGHKVTATFGRSGALMKRVQGKANVDIVILRSGQIAKIKKAGILVNTLTPNIAKVGIGVAVKKGAAKPDVSSVAKLKAALAEVKTIGYADPKRGFLGGHLERSFKKLGMMQQIQAKKRTFPPGSGLWKALESGKVALGFGPMSSIVARRGLDLVGSVPSEIQAYNQFTAGVPKASKNQKAAKEMLDFLASPAAAALLKSKGLVPG